MIFNLTYFFEFINFQSVSLETFQLNLELTSGYK